VAPRRFPPVFSSVLGDELQKQVERAVLEEILELHPDHLTVPELILKMAINQNEDEPITHSVRDLKCSGLVRYIGDVVVPTHAALRSGVLLTA
jgi:hypothetical protein